ncbi:MAG: DinB family protein [Alphaproteobacteria bacterium]|jgi:uncharacterized damage-inducible protein DinB
MSMLDCSYIQKMARYNRWQNENLYSVADVIADDERRRDRGAFFGSIHKIHHRGQVHCMLTQAGGKPHDTDLAFMPE